MEDQVILVNQKDQIIGVGEKIKVHKEALLHRAFSIFILNSKGELLLQRRALNKYHSPGLWSNTCCGHPRPAEQVKDAAHRRLQAEMGFDCLLEERGSFIYWAELDNGFIEHEYDHLLRGRFDRDPTPNVHEAIDWKWISLEVLARDLEDNPTNYTFWLKLIVNSQLHNLGVRSVSAET